MNIILRYIIKGAVYGGLGAIALFIVGFILEVVSVGCAILTCDCDKSTMFDWSGMWNLFFICVIGGAVIGLFYGFYKAKETSDAEAARIDAENFEEACKQRAEWASEVKKKAHTVNNICSKNKELDKPLVSTTYQANAQMIEIMNELTKIAEKQGKIDSLVEELSEKEGVSLWKS